MVPQGCGKGEVFYCGHVLANRNVSFRNFPDTSTSPNLIHCSSSGGVLSTPLPGIHGMKPGATMVPFFGIKPKTITTKEASGFLCIEKPWPGMARSILHDHDRFMKTYFDPHPGHYFTGDGGYFDDDNHLWITGRVDDVINKAGHRLGTSEIESALVVGISFFPLKSFVR